MPESHSQGHPGVMPYSWLSAALDLAQMVMDVQKPLTTFGSTTLAKSHSLGHPGVMPYSWLSEALDLAQMVMDIWTRVQITIFIIPNNFF